jgi:hypothetical protein
VTGGRNGPSKRPLLVVAGAVLCAAVVVVRWRSRQPEPADDDDSSTTMAEAPPAASPTPALPPPAPVARPEAVANDGVPIVPAHNEDPRDPNVPMHPHPITPRHERIFAENRLIGALNGAMDVKDVAGMRRLLEEYRRDYPEDDNQLQEGYAVIAECLEQLGDQSREAAQRWVAAHNGSTLKRFVNRHCLESAPGP